MATHVQQVRSVQHSGAVDDPDQVVERQDTVRSDAVEDRPGVLAARIVWFVAGVLLSLIAFRFVFILLGANPSNDFVNFIYNVTHPFVAPFFGIFNYQQQLGTTHVEYASLVAMAVYWLIAFGLTRLLTLRRPQAR